MPVLPAVTSTGHFLGQQRSSGDTVAVKSGVAVYQPLFNLVDFCEGNTELNATGNNCSPPTTTPVLRSFTDLAQTQLTDTCTFIQPLVQEIANCLEYFFACREYAPATTSAYIALPCWYRKKKWHKYFKHMQQVKHLPKLQTKAFTTGAANSTGVQAQSTPPSSYTIWYAPPAAQMALQFMTEEGESQIMLFSGYVANDPASILIDSGATHSFVDESYASKHHLSIIPDGGTVICGGNAEAAVKGYVSVSIQLQSFVDTVKLYVIAFPKQPDFDVVFGQTWLKQYGASIDYVTEKVSFQMQGQQLHIQCGDAQRPRL